MNTNTYFSRRTWLAATGVISAAQLLGLNASLAKNQSAKTPALTAEEILAIETPMGKRGLITKYRRYIQLPFPVMI